MTSLDPGRNVKIFKSLNGLWLQTISLYFFVHFAKLKSLKQPNHGAQNQQFLIVQTSISSNTSLKNTFADKKWDILQYITYSDIYSTSRLYYSTNTSIHHNKNTQNDSHPFKFPQTLTTTRRWNPPSPGPPFKKNTNIQANIAQNHF